MLLIADSGSTKTRWCIISGKTISRQCITPGINPFLQTDSEISQMLQQEFAVKKEYFDAVYFYGSGCTDHEKKLKVKKALEKVIDAAAIMVESDLMAAARSLCGNRPGIAAIIGTGSNSCYYDGLHIKKHVAPLGYILGDEGSGTAMGKKLLADILKNQLPGDIIDEFFKKYRFTPAEILDKIYLNPFPNRFMAGFCVFLAENIDHPAIHTLVKSRFTGFFVRNISQYPESGRMPVNVTGSVGWHFRKILNEAAVENGFRLGIVTESPMDGLLEYHKNQIQ
jgi:glucosamine kinase